MSREIFIFVVKHSLGTEALSLLVYYPVNVYYEICEEGTVSAHYWKGFMSVNPRRSLDFQN